jgi:glycosyltransferase involved in cell wall biosynthesis
MTNADARKMQYAVAESSRTVFNSEWTKSQYPDMEGRVIPLPVDFDLFEPGNPMGLQQSLGLPDGCICWVGASQGAAAEIKGFDIFMRIARTNPDLYFVAVFKDAIPDYCPPNVRMYERVDQEMLCRIMGACRVGLCTSRQETQHLAGIEMGACGLPLVVPPVGCYWKRENMPGVVVESAEMESTTPAKTFTAALRSELAGSRYFAGVREYWQKDFDRPVIQAAWERLVEEVES